MMLNMCTQYFKKVYNLIVQSIINNLSNKSSLIHNMCFRVQTMVLNFGSMLLKFCRLFIVCGLLLFFLYLFFSDDYKADVIIKMAIITKKNYSIQLLLPLGFLTFPLLYYMLVCLYWDFTLYCTKQDSKESLRYWIFLMVLASSVIVLQVYFFKELYYLNSVFDIIITWVTITISFVDLLVNDCYFLLMMFLLVMSVIFILTVYVYNFFINNDERLTYLCVTILLITFLVFLICVVINFNSLKTETLLLTLSINNKNVSSVTILFWVFTLPLFFLTVYATRFLVSTHVVSSTWNELLYEHTHYYSLFDIFSMGKLLTEDATCKKDETLLRQLNTVYFLPGTIKQSLYSLALALKTNQDVVPELKLLVPDLELLVFQQVYGTYLYDLFQKLANFLDLSTQTINNWIKGWWLTIFVPLLFNLLCPKWFPMLWVLLNQYCWPSWFVLVKIFFVHLIFGFGIPFFLYLYKEKLDIQKFYQVMPDIVSTAHDRFKYLLFVIHMYVFMFFFIILVIWFLVKMLSVLCYFLWPDFFIFMYYEFPYFCLYAWIIFTFTGLLLLFTLLLPIIRYLIFPYFDIFVKLCWYFVFNPLFLVYDQLIRFFSK